MNARDHTLKKNKIKVHYYMVNKAIISKMIIQQGVFLSIHGWFCLKYNFRGTENVLENWLSLMSICDRKEEDVEL